MKRFENLNLEYKREYTEQIRKAVIPSPTRTAGRSSSAWTMTERSAGWTTSTARASASAT